MSASILSTAPKPNRARFVAEGLVKLVGRGARLSRPGKRMGAADVGRPGHNRYGFDGVIGYAATMNRVFEQVQRLAADSATVLVWGETGSGKQLIAELLHRSSSRCSGPLRKIHCASLPEVFESALSGGDSGAPVSVSRAGKGRFKLADGGTLLLDEVGELSAASQAQLLRMLRAAVPTNVRVIATSSRDLEAEVEAGRFRDDLYQLFRPGRIDLPALRERMEDLPHLARFLVDKVGRLQGRALSLSDGALRLLFRHDWPGNVRELQNCIERAAVMSRDGVIDAGLIMIPGLVEWGSRAVKRESLGGGERQRVVEALEGTGWVQTKAARLLGMTPRQVAYRIRKLNIALRRF